MEVRGSLPPARAVIALECVVRTGSVTAAAEELCVTQSAVSKQIAALEAWLGQPLFNVNRRRMIPTKAARHLADAAAVAWGVLSAAVDEIGRRGSTAVLQILAPATFAMRWLLPRLASFQTEFPDIKVSVRQTHTPENWLEMPFDVVIRRGGSSPPSLSTEVFLRENLVLVAQAASPWVNSS